MEDRQRRPIAKLWLQKRRKAFTTCESSVTLGLSAAYCVIWERFSLSNSPLYLGCECPTGATAGMTDKEDGLLPELYQQWVGTEKMRLWFPTTKPTFLAYWQMRKLPGTYVGPSCDSERLCGHGLYREKTCHTKLCANKNLTYNYWFKPRHRVGCRSAGFHKPCPFEFLDLDSTLATIFKLLVYRGVQGTCLRHAKQTKPTCIFFLSLPSAT